MVVPEQMLICYYSVVKMSEWENGESHSPEYLIFNIILNKKQWFMCD